MTIICWGTDTNQRPIYNNIPEGRYQTLAIDSWYACATAYDQTTITCWGENHRGSVPDQITPTPKLNQQIAYTLYTNNTDRLELSLSAYQLNLADRGSPQCYP